jgi:hypothetical protein
MGLVRRFDGCMRSQYMDPGESRLSPGFDGAEPASAGARYLPMVNDVEAALPT